MLLILSRGGRSARELSGSLNRAGADFMFHFESFAEAGGFGKGDVIVGKLSYRGLVRVIRQNRVSAVIDAIDTPENHSSLAAVNVAEDMKIPLIKLIEPTVPRNISIAADPGKVRCGVDYSYAGVASKINNTVGGAVFLSRPINVRVIAEQVFDRNDLYVPIRAGSEFDVELALQYGVPLLNVKEYNDFSGKDGILKVLRDVGAKLLITDSAMDISDKLAAAAEAGAEVIFTQGSGYDYKHIFDNPEALAGFLEEKGLIGEDGEQEPDPGNEDGNNEITDEGVKE